MKYDIVIVGMGPSAIFCAYELLKLNSTKKVLLIEKGKKIEDRICPISKSGKCIKCKPICNIIGGFSGAGAFSDGKLLLYHLSSYNKMHDDLYIGGKDDSYIKKYYTKKEIMSLLQYTDEIYLSLGASKNIEGLKNLNEIERIQRLSYKNKLSLIDVPLRHLGTEKSHELYYNLEKKIESKIDMMYNTSVDELLIKNNKIYGVKCGEKEIFADKVILAVGVDGSFWLEKECKLHNIKTRNGYMDVGVRYELKNSVMSNINELMYEGKFIGKLKPYNDRIRTYCQNPGGYVTPETYDNGLTLVNGHSYKEKKSENTNLALLVSYKFDAPFKEPIKYGFNIAEKCNMLTGNGVIVQRLIDFKNNRKTTIKDIQNNTVVPTMNSATAGDLSYVLDHRTYVNIMNFIKKLDNVIPGFMSNDNLLYGPEIKFYGNEVVLDKNLETSVNGLYSIGTGGGLTIGLMMVSASGVLMARILERKEI